MEWTLTDDAAGVFQEHIDLKNWQNDLMEVAKYFYENGIAGYFLRWINSGMKNIPYDMMNQLFRFFTGTMEGMAQHSKLESSHT